VLASRFDESGKALWIPPFDLGVVANAANPSERIVATLARPGVVRVGDLDVDANGPHTPIAPHKGR
jgi:hypothetical protein